MIYFSFLTAIANSGEIPAASGYIFRIFPTTDQEGINLVEAAARRDFTINSLALSYPDGVLIDPNGGREDLKAGLVRAVANPGARFSYRGSDHPESAR